MENNAGIVTIEPKSYSYVKSILYGFKGWDKYILTEDEMLKSYLEDLLHGLQQPLVKYKIIYIAGGSNVVDIMYRNSTEEFFEASDNVISVLDGDQKGQAYCRDNDKVYFIPFESVEKQLIIHYENGDLNGIGDIDIPAEARKPHKALYKIIKRQGLMSDSDIFSLINGQKVEEVDEFKRMLVEFLG